MSDQAVQAFAFVARRQGTGSLPAGEWGQVMSLELRWLPPAAASAYEEAAEAAGLLRREGNALRLTVPWRELEVPRRFRFDASDLAVEPLPESSSAPPNPSPQEPQTGGAWADPFLQTVAAIEATGTTRAEILEAVQTWQEHMGGHLEAEAAALLAAAEAGLDVRADAATALTRLKQASQSAEG